MISNALAERVERERASHDEDDVLANNLDLKDRFFAHLQDDPAQNALWDEMDSILEDLSDQNILDLGCGKGEAALGYLEAGASVSGIDISTVYVNNATETVREAGYDDNRFSFQVMDAHQLEFEDGEFDMVVGNAILHHLEPALCLRECARVLKPGGTAMFLEPLRDNPLLVAFRHLTPQARTVDEAPFTRADLRKFSAMEEFDFDVSLGGLLTTPTCVFTSLAMPKHPSTFLPRTAFALENKLNSTPVTRKLFGPWNRLALFKFTKRS